MVLQKCWMRLLNALDLHLQIFIISVIVRHLLYRQVRIIFPSNVEKFQHFNEYLPYIYLILDVDVLKSCKSWITFLLSLWYYLLDVLVALIPFNCKVLWNDININLLAHLFIIQNYNQVWNLICNENLLYGVIKLLFYFFYLFILRLDQLLIIFVLGFHVVHEAFAEDYFSLDASYDSSDFIQFLS